MLLAHRSVDRDLLLRGIERALEAGSVDPAVVLVEARRWIESSNAAPAPIGSLQRFDRPLPALSAYDELLAVGS